MNINWVAEAIDTVFLFGGKAARILNIKKNRLCFAVWIACTLYWCYIDIVRELYAQALFTVPSMLIHVWGWWKWTKDDKEKKAEQA